ncbi:Alpha-tubulin N-acetyltransferase, partial [Operophtera brumata]
MDWILDVNVMLKNDITKITNSLLPPGFEGDVRSIRLMQDSLSKVIDRLGEQSAAEQGLSKVITTADKLRTADSHTLYLIKDASARDGKGEVLGMLKVGRKHLFLFDEQQSVREVEPLCVLDFFVLRSCQRHGLGRALFDHMLERCELALFNIVACRAVQDMQTSAHRLAVDGPSDKMEAFLAKNYGVTRLLRQNNNFAMLDAAEGHTERRAFHGQQIK